MSKMPSKVSTTVPIPFSYATPVLIARVCTPSNTEATTSATFREFECVEEVAVDVQRRDGRRVSHEVLRLGHRPALCDEGACVGVAERPDVQLAKLGSLGGWVEHDSRTG
jgi:hypothetical protein